MKYVIATHGKLAEGFASAISVLSGYSDIYTICAYMEEGDFPGNFETLIKELGADEEVIVFTDFLGGSVTQTISGYMSTYPNLHIIAGANMALIMETVMCQVEMNEEAVGPVVEQARQQMVYLNPLLRKES